MLAKSVKPSWIALSVISLSGCTHHSVRVETTNKPDNRILINEEVRPWPATLSQNFIIKIPNGDYAYDPQEYEIQTNYPERPVKTIKFSDMEIVKRGENMIGYTGGWIAVYRNWIDIQLLWMDQPATINGKYKLKPPFVRPKP